MESSAWGKRYLDSRLSEDATKLRTVLQRSQRRSRYTSTVLNFDSDRAIAQVQPYQFTFDVRDPYEEDVGWDMSYNFLRNRFQDVQHSLFRLVESQRRKISEQAIKLMGEGASGMQLNFGDPIAKFKFAFSQLLAPKKLCDLDVRTQQLQYELDGTRYSIDTLSSGEREVVNIVF